jgi:hypothetical protein
LPIRGVGFQHRTCNTLKFVNLQTLLEFKLSLVLNSNKIE